MSTISIIIMDCLVIAVFAINNARVLKLEDRIQQMQNNIDVVNKLANEAIDAFGKFVAELKKSADVALKKSADTADNQKSE